MWDAETMFSNDQTLADADSDYIVDARSNDMGKGHSIYLQVMTSAGASGPLTIKLKTASTAGMAGAVIVAEYTIPADKVARGGVVLAAQLPTGCKRYLQLNYAGATGGAVNAGLVLGAHTANLD